MSDLLVEKRGTILAVTFNRPAKKNAITPEMVVRLAEAWTAFRDDDELRVAVLTGIGDAFSAGADLGRLIPLMTRARAPEDDFDRALLAAGRSSRRPSCAGSSSGSRSSPP
jgi:enoyl-CoA hydratase